MPALRWIVAANPPGYDEPAWKRSAAIDDRGTIYAPAVISDGECTALFKAACDGDVVGIEVDGHIFLPTRWLAREYPGDADIYALIEAAFAKGERS
jgi:hypothetical protein